MKRMRFILVSLMVSGMLLSPVRGNAGDGTVPDELVLYMGEVKLFPVSSLKRVAVANPSIADVTNISDSEMTLVPKTPGVTTLMIWDNFGEQSFQLKVLPEHTDELKARIDSVLSKLDFPELYTVAEEDEGKVMLMGRVKTPQDRERIVVALGNLYDKAVDVIQVKEEEGVVNIDVQVLELNKDATKTLGMSWPGQVTVTEVNSPGLTGAKWSEMWSVLDFRRNALTMTLDMLIQEGKARVLSRPRLSCQSGKEAELLVGGEKPVLTTQVNTGGSSTEVEYKEFGIKLNIKPTITDVDTKRIKLAVFVEVSDVEEAVILGSTNSPTALAYPITKRNATTELFLDDGQTLSIGGLIKQKTEEDVRRVPFLSDIPLIGLLFRQKETKIGGGQGERGDTELFITITPSIVSFDKGRAVAGKAQEEITIITGASAEDECADVAMGYAKVVKKKILEKILYPEVAKKAGFQGTVILDLKLSHQGEVVGVSVKDTSGYKTLDDEALKAVEEVGMFPPFPEAIMDQELSLEIPIEYLLS